MLEENKNEAIITNEFLNKRKQKKIDSDKRQSKAKKILLSIFLCAVIGTIAYFASSISNVKTIEIVGNIYTKQEDILKLSGLSANSKYVLTFPSNVIDRIKKNELISYCDVEKLEDRLIRITIKEKKIIGYAYEDESNVLILDDDSRIILTKANLYLIEKVPLIEGFDKEHILLIERQLEEIDYKMINEISEIHYYPQLKYQSLELIMRDGNYVFTSAYGLNLLNKYYDIDSSVSTGRNNCYYFEDISGNAYMSACPWEEVVEEEIIEEEIETDEQD